jgi:sugar phosphate isomerase/epimerase
MRLGGPVFTKHADPDQWVQAHAAAGYTAAYVPGETWEYAAPFVEAARKQGLMLAEVGAWSNPLSTDAIARNKAIELCCQRLDLADRAGARCCVNIAGSRGPQWDGPHADNLTADTFDLIVATVRRIIDAVRPTRTFYTLETMPWVFPDSPDSYVALLKAIERKEFAVHLDAVNLINSPRRYFGNAALVKECFAKLGPFIKSCHLKDISLAGKLTVHLDEVRAGLGGMDYRTLLAEAAKLPPDLPVMLEHLATPEEYAAAAQHVRTVAGEIGVTLR